ncbi:hypothetical protein Q3O98_18525 [Ralstonia pseudosolanacearum]|nr:hypothetical protein [Ralstonia pseudosolanacearum]MDO3623079.1 hypothetical protein [Ralstonia pseudosolanacearum]
MTLVLDEKIGHPIVLLSPATIRLFEEQTQGKKRSLTYTVLIYT